MPCHCCSTLLLEHKSSPRACINTLILMPTAHSAPHHTCFQVLSRAALWRLGLGAEKILATPSMEEGSTVLGLLTRSAMRKYHFEFEDGKCRVEHQVGVTECLFSQLTTVWVSLSVCYMCCAYIFRTWTMKKSRCQEVGTQIE